MERGDERGRCRQNTVKHFQTEMEKLEESDDVFLEGEIRGSVLGGRRSTARSVDEQSPAEAVWMGMDAAGEVCSSRFRSNVAGHLLLLVIV